MTILTSAWHNATNSSHHPITTMASQEKHDKVTADKSFQTVVKNAIWVYKLVYSLSPKDTIIFFGSDILIAIIPTITAYFSARLIDEIISLLQNSSTETIALSLTSPVIIIILLTTFFSTLNRITQRIYRYSYERIRRYHLRFFEHELKAKISELDLAQFENPKLSNEIQKGKDNIYKIEVFLQSSVRTIASTISTIIAGIIVLNVSPLLFLFIFVLSIPNNIIYAQFIREIWGYYNGFIEKSRKRWTLTWLLTNEPFIPEYRITQANTRIGQIGRELLQYLSDKLMAIHKRNLHRNILSGLINAAVYIVSPLYLINLILRGTISIGDFTFYQRKILDFSRELDSIMGSFLEISDSATYVTYVRNIFELESEIVEGSEKIGKPIPPKIEFSNVSFKYPRSKRYALRNVSLTIQPKEEIAIVGENGAGKTTLIKLLLRFYDPTEGKILINGTPIQKLPLKDYYDTISAIFQEFNTYDPLTIKENISIGDIKKKSTKEALIQAAKKADAHEFIMKLDKKYEQVVAKEFTGGTKLSWGQWQKVALARMFYRDRPILILDEPTASIDAAAEYKIFKRIYRMFEKKTVIIISHRFSTVRNAQKIYVLKEGKIIEKGSHDALLKKNGTYAKAFKLQAEGYQAK